MSDQKFTIRARRHARIAIILGIVAVLLGAIAVGLSAAAMIGSRAPVHRAGLIVTAPSLLAAMIETGSQSPLARPAAQKVCPIPYTGVIKKIYKDLPSGRLPFVFTHDIFVMPDPETCPPPTGGWINLRLQRWTYLRHARRWVWLVQGDPSTQFFPLPKGQSGFSLATQYLCIGTGRWRSVVAWVLDGEGDPLPSIGSQVANGPKWFYCPR
jgi:hypothetical protein